MILSQDRGFAFVHLYKTAGESIEEAYDTVALWSDVQIGGSDFGERVQPGFRARTGLYKHSTAAEIRAAVGADVWDRWYTFGVVRDPVARAVSLYTYACRIDRAGGRKDRLRRMFGRSRREATRWAIVRQARAASGFSEWIRHPEVMRTIGLRPQTDFLCDREGRLLVTEVLKMESLAEGWASVCSRLGLPDVPLPHRNASGSVPRPEVTDADRRWIAARAARDYQTFGYPSP